MPEIRIEYRLAVESAMHVGSGFRGVILDRIALKDACNRPFIPGSQMKGIVRDCCRRMAGALGLDSGLNPHDDTNPSVGLAFEQLGSPVDRLFGTRTTEGSCFLRFSDLLPVSDHQQRFGGRSRVQLSRVLGSARPHHLYSTELVESLDAEQVYRGRIHGWHERLAAEEGAIPVAYGLLVAGLLMVEAVGADRTVGLGACRPVIDRLEINGQSREPEEALDAISDPELGDLYELLREVA